MDNNFGFNEEDFKDPKKFMMKFREILKDMKSGLTEDRRKELSEFMKSVKHMNLQILDEKSIVNGKPRNRRFGSFEEAINVTKFMITNGIEEFLRIPKRMTRSYDKNIEEVYQHYVDVEQLEYTEVFISNVNYLIEYFVESEEYEKCVYLQWLQEQYSNHLSN